jgi:hypothetical protein
MTEIPPELINYLVNRDRAREERTDQALAALTPRELALVREAAVMGYVQGAMAQKGQAIPVDSAILRLVVTACLAIPDLYPTLSDRPRSSR